MRAIACSKSVPPGTHARHGLHTPEGGLAHRGLGNLIPRTTRRSQKHHVPFSQHFFAIDPKVCSVTHASGSRKAADAESCTQEARPSGSTAPLFLGCKMWADPQYLTSW